MKVAPLPKHPNEFEHRESFLTFLSYFVLYGTLGGFIGRSIDKFISTLENENDSKQKQIILFVLQIVINGILFYIAFQSIQFNRKSGILSLDDWIGSTFQGLIFATTMYSMQNNFYENLKSGLF